MTAIRVVGEPELTGGKASVKYKPSIEAVLHDGTKLPAEAVGNLAGAQAFYDIAIIKIDRVGTKPLPFTTYSSIPDGAEVYMMGFPIMVPTAAAYKGIVASKFQAERGSLGGRSISADYAQIQAPISKGFSGGPLLDYATNRVFGVVVLKQGGINSELETLAKQIASSPSHGGMSIGGVNPNDTFLKIIGVLDAFLSAGSGFSVSTDHISAFLKAELAGKN